MLPLGTPAPPFRLPEPLTGQTRSLKEFSRAPLLLVAFICNHCPYVIHLRSALIALARDYAPHMQVVAVNSNSPETHPQDSPEKMADMAREWHFPFPYLFDQTQETARAYHAACTPDFFLFDTDRKLVYRGRFDSTRPEHRTAPDTPGKGAEPTGEDLRRAIDLTLKGVPVPEEDQKPSLGCNIKWAP